MNNEITFQEINTFSNQLFVDQYTDYNKNNLELVAEKNFAATVAISGENHDQHSNPISGQPDWLRINHNQVQIVNPQTPVTAEFKNLLGNPTASAFGGQTAWVSIWANTVTRNPKFENIEVEIFTPRALADPLVKASEELSILGRNITERRADLHPGVEIYIDTVHTYPTSAGILSKLGMIPDPDKRTTPFVDGLKNLAIGLSRSWVENGMPRYVITSNWEAAAVVAYALKIMAKDGVTVRPIIAHVPHALGSEKIYEQMLEKIERGQITTQDQLRQEITKIIDDERKHYPQRFLNHALTLSPDTTIIDVFTPNNIREVPHQERTNVYQSIQNKMGVTQGLVQPLQSDQRLGEGIKYLMPAPMINDRSVFNRDPSTPLIAENIPIVRQVYANALDRIDSTRRDMPVIAFFGRINDGKNPKMLLRAAVAIDQVTQHIENLLADTIYSNITLSEFAQNHTDRLDADIDIRITDNDHVKTSFRQIIEFKLGGSLDQLLQSDVANQRLDSILPEKSILDTHNILININGRHVTGSVFEDRLQGLINKDGYHTQLNYSLTPDVTTELNAMIDIVKANPDSIGKAMVTLSLPQEQHAALLHLMGRAEGFDLNDGTHIAKGSLGVMTSRTEYHGIVPFEIADSGVPVISAENGGARSLFTEPDRRINPSVGSEKHAANDPVEWGIVLGNAYENYDDVRAYQIQVMDNLHANMADSFMKPFLKMDSDLPEGHLPKLDLNAVNFFVVDPLDPKLPAIRDEIIDVYAGDNSFLVQEINRIGMEVIETESSTYSSREANLGQDTPNSGGTANDITTQAQRILTENASDPALQDAQLMQERLQQHQVAMEKVANEIIFAISELQRPLSNTNSAILLDIDGTLLAEQGFYYLDLSQAGNKPITVEMLREALTQEYSQPYVFESMRKAVQTLNEFKIPYYLVTDRPIAEMDSVRATIQALGLAGEYLQEIKFSSPENRAALRSELAANNGVTIIMSVGNEQKDLVQSDEVAMHPNIKNILVPNVVGENNVVEFNNNKLNIPIPKGADNTVQSGSGNVEYIGGNPLVGNSTKDQTDKNTPIDITTRKPDFEWPQEGIVVSPTENQHEQLTGFPASNETLKNTLGDGIFSIPAADQDIAEKTAVQGFPDERNQVKGTVYVNPIPDSKTDKSEQVYAAQLYAAWNLASVISDQALFNSVVNDYLDNNPNMDIATILTMPQPMQNRMKSLLLQDYKERYQDISDTKIAAIDQRIIQLREKSAQLTEAKNQLLLTMQQNSVTIISAAPIRIPAANLEMYANTDQQKITELQTRLTSFAERVKTNGLTPADQNTWQILQQQVGEVMAEARIYAVAGQLALLEGMESVLKVTSETVNALQIATDQQLDKLQDFTAKDVVNGVATAAAALGTAVAGIANWVWNGLKPASNF